MNWVKFERSDMLRDRADTPEVSIWKKGTIAFTKAAEEKYGIKQYRYASLYFDPDTRKIGIKLTNDRSRPKDVFKITQGKSNLVITAPPFFKKLKLSTEKTKRYEILEEDDMLVIKLAS